MPTPPQRIVVRVWCVCGCVHEAVRAVGTLIFTTPANRGLNAYEEQAGVSQLIGDLSPL